MNERLFEDSINIRSILEKTVDSAMAYYADQKTRTPSLAVEDLPRIPPPEEGMGAHAVLELFQREFALKMANSAGPRYFGFVTGGSTPAAVAGDWLVSVYDQVMSGSSDSVAHAIERQTIGFLAGMFGLGEDFSGTFVTGATMSNFVSLATARQWIGKQLGVDFAEDGFTATSVNVLSATPHSSVLKSMSMLGIGRKHWIKVNTLPGREAADIRHLEAMLQEIDKPCIVVANAGTVNSVDFDDLAAIADLKKKYAFWLHIDAAFGGFAAVSPHYRHFVKGLHLADTVTVDAHKWMNVPYDAAMQFTRHRNLQVEVFQNNAAYLGNPSATPDSMHLTPENSRRFRALPAWFALMAYGVAGIRDIVERNCDAARRLGELIHGSARFRLLAPVRMNVVCFTFNEELPSMDRVNRFLREIRDDGQVFFTPTNFMGVPAIRAAISNWQTSIDDINLAMEVLVRIHSTTIASPVSR